MMLMFSSSQQHQSSHPYDIQSKDHQIDYFQSQQRDYQPVVPFSPTSILNTSRPLLSQQQPIKNFLSPGGVGGNPQVSPT